MGTRKSKSPTHNRDRHYNYPREDAVLILNPLEDKSADLAARYASFRYSLLIKIVEPPNSKLRRSWSLTKSYYFRNQFRAG